MEEQKKWKEMEGWDGGREVLEGGEIYILTADLHTVQQKPTQHCKVIIPQLKRNKIFKKNQPPLPHCIDGEIETQRGVKTSLSPHREERAEPDKGLRAPGSNQALSSRCCDGRNLCNQAAPPEAFPSGGSQRGLLSEVWRSLRLGLGPLI